MNDVTAPRRQHFAGLLVLLGWQSRHMLRAAWPILIAAYFQNANDAKYFLWAISVGAVFTLVGAVLHFWRFTFNVSGGKFHVHKGVNLLVAEGLLCEEARTPPPPPVWWLYASWKSGAASLGLV